MIAHEPKYRPSTLLVIFLATFVVLFATVFIVIRRDRQVALPSGEYSLTVGNMTRTYQVHSPSVAHNEKLPLVVVLHGALGTGQQAERDYGWSAKADAAGFIVAYPDGYKRTWNAERCCGPAAKENVDDIDFITQMVNAIAEKAPIDRDRLYVTGISNGGMLAYRLACETNTFAAIGPVAATMTSECSSPKPISLIHIHGLTDATIPFGGGPGKRDNGGAGDSPADTSGPPIPELLTSWRVAGSCAEPSDEKQDPVTTSIAECPDGRAVALVTIAGAGHQWPGGAAQRRAGQRIVQLDPPSTALNATDTIWEFFATRPKSPQ